MNLDDLPFSPAADRNKQPIAEVLLQVLPPVATILEVASGTGQHAAHFAACSRRWVWQPTEPEPQALSGIEARCARLDNVRTPVVLDVLAVPWPIALGKFEAVYCANMLHISPWATCAALMQGAVRHLLPGGLLILYGPYVVDGEATSPGNLAFDADLRDRDPAWGLRNLANVMVEASTVGLRLLHRFNMPANNLMLVFQSRDEMRPALLGQASGELVKGAE